MNKWIEDVKEFNKVYGVDYPAVCTESNSTQMRLVDEEHTELQRAFCQYMAALVMSQKRNRLKLQYLMPSVIRYTFSLD